MANPYKAAIKILSNTEEYDHSLLLHRVAGISPAVIIKAADELAGEFQRPISDFKLAHAIKLLRNKGLKYDQAIKIYSTLAEVDDQTAMMAITR